MRRCDATARSRGSNRRCRSEARPLGGGGLDATLGMPSQGARAARFRLPVACGEPLASRRIEGCPDLILAKTRLLDLPCKERLWQHSSRFSPFGSLSVMALQTAECNAGERAVPCNEGASCGVDLWDNVIPVTCGRSRDLSSPVRGACHRPGRRRRCWLRYVRAGSRHTARRGRRAVAGNARDWAAIVPTPTQGARVGSTRYEHKP